MSNLKDDHENDQKGPQAHAEGQHGKRTHAKFLEPQHEGQHRESREVRAQHDRARDSKRLRAKE
jgi:hypothetical protein